MVSVVWPVSPTGDIVFFLVFPLPPISSREMTAILFFIFMLIMLILGASFVPLV